MSRAIYNDYRGWVMPENEEDDEGYLVEYADAQRPNVEGHLGYVSWSPKDVFERSYRAAGQGASASEPTPGPAGEGARDPEKEEEKKESWADRLRTEFAELHSRLGKLESFLQTDAFQCLDVEDSKLLSEQYRHMVYYHGTLSLRVSRAQTAEAEQTVKLH